MKICHTVYTKRLGVLLLPTKVRELYATCYGLVDIAGWDFCVAVAHHLFFLLYFISFFWVFVETGL